MASLTELTQWEASIYQLETTDPVKGGNDGISNLQGKQLANRTAYLKQQVELKAPLASPKFTGAPETTTADADTSSKQIASTEFVIGQAATATPLVDGNAAVGTSKKFARQDHVHPADTKAAPPGEVAYFAMSSAPTGWMKCNGSSISRTTYAALFAVIGTTFGTGNGTTTFNLPDLRGEFLRGFDDSRGVDSGRTFASSQGDAIRNITGAISGSSNASFFDGGSGALVISASVSGTNVFTGTTGAGYNDFLFDASKVVPTAAENRPRNIALLACIKY